MDLIRDVLDNQVVDSKGRNMGRVDGIIMEVRAGQRPLLTYIEIGGVTLARRLSPRIGRWAEKIARKLGKGAESHRIAFSKIEKVGINVDVDVEVENTQVGAFERWLSKHIVSHIPGAG